MKILIRNTKFLMSNTAVLKIVLIFCFLLEMQLCFSQPHVTMSLQNCAAVTHKILAFDLYIMNDDTVNSTQLAALAFGINYDSLILNGGAPASSTFAFQPGTEDSTLTLLANNYLTLHELSFHHLKLNTQTLNHTNAPVLIPKMQYKVGRFTFTNSGVWAANSSPAFAMQLMAQTNHTLCIALIYINGNPR